LAGRSAASQSDANKIGLASNHHKLEKEFWALRNVSLEIKQGEVVGIIGRNGAGKSTLLKILSRITEPTEGEVQITGRVASLLEVGTGFHPELTGRENVFLNGAILGMSRAEIKRKFDEIVAFAEVDKFLDTPVKRYSSGMYVRLAFAVAAHLEPEILIVDEVLAVGDTQFQKKCLGKMGEVAKGGRTVLFVSHNMGVVTTLTERCIYLQDGQIKASGNSRQIVKTYLMQAHETQTDGTISVETYRRDSDRNYESDVKIIGIRVQGSNRDGSNLATAELGARIRLDVHLKVFKAVHGGLLDLQIKSAEGFPITDLFSLDKNFSLFIEPGFHTINLEIKDLPLAPGRYYLDVSVAQALNVRAYDVILDFPILNVVNTGQVTHYLDRPWGALHSSLVTWKITHNSE
jgi:lipopolysaccharide transport system ATP-binding protein